MFEAFAYEIRDGLQPHFYVTEDSSKGPVRRYTPAANTPQGWDMLHGSGGTIEYLEFIPGGNTFRWTASRDAGKSSASNNYPNTEGIAHHDGVLYFVTKKKNKVFILDLDAKTYTTASTQTGALPGGGNFDFGPDQLYLSEGGLTYFSEDTNKKGLAGIFAWNGNTWYTVLEAEVNDYAGETTGIVFSPDGMSMLFCSQDTGHLFQVKRLDGLPFEGHKRVLKWKYDLGRRR